MRNVEYASDQMDIDTKGVPEPLDRQPMPILTSDNPYLYPPGPAPDGGIGETVTVSLSPPRHANRPRSRLDRLLEWRMAQRVRNPRDHRVKKRLHRPKVFPFLCILFLEKGMDHAA